jgi:hypothetical protein
VGLTSGPPSADTSGDVYGDVSGEGRPTRGHFWAYPSLGSRTDGFDRLDGLDDRRMVNSRAKRGRCGRRCEHGHDNDENEYQNGRGLAAERHGMFSWRRCTVAKGRDRKALKAKDNTCGGQQRAGLEFGASSRGSARGSRCLLVKEMVW